jgi:hypothetical protein
VVRTAPNSTPVLFVNPETKKQASRTYLTFSCCLHAACMLVQYLKGSAAVCDSHSCRCGTHHPQCMSKIFFASIDFKSKDSHLCLWHGAHVKYRAKKWFSSVPHTQYSPESILLCSQPVV